MSGKDLPGLQIKAFSDGEERKRALFHRLGWFLMLDAVLFFVLLVAAFVCVAYYGADWHVFLAPVIAGAVGAIIAVITVRAVWAMPGKKDDVPTFGQPFIDIGKNLTE